MPEPARVRSSVRYRSASQSAISTRSALSDQASKRPHRSKERTKPLQIVDVARVDGVAALCSGRHDDSITYGTGKDVTKYIERSPF